MQNKDLYFVAVKVFLTRDEGDLLITKDIFGDWDIPGGRLREMDFEVDLKEVVKRKMKEELGVDLKYLLHDPVIYMRHEREEILENDLKEKRRIFAIGYLAKYLEGDIALGKNHEQYEWVSIKEFKPHKYFNGGWLKGVEDFQKYYANIQ